MALRLCPEAPGDWRVTRSLLVEASRYTSAGKTTYISVDGPVHLNRTETRKLRDQLTALLGDQPEDPKAQLEVKIKPVLDFSEVEAALERLRG